MPRTVKPEGRPDAKIAFIGEAPGGQEERLGRPFVGPSGQFLDECLRNAGIQRRDCYLTNVVKERPYNNDITQFIDITKSQPKISAEGQRYLDEFLEEINGLATNVLVPLGNVPLWALTGLKMITKRHGSILKDRNGRKVIPTIHPAAVLREFMFKYPLMNDLRRIKQQAEFPDIRLKNYPLLIGQTFLDTIAFLRQINSKSITLDIEVLGGEVSCISIGDGVETISIPFTSEKGDYFTIEQEQEIWRLLTFLLEHPGITKLGQNLAFDSTFLHNRYGIVVRPMWDTMIAQGILYPDLPKGLDFLTATYTDVPYYKDDGKQWFKLGGSFRDLWSYNAKDSAVLPDIQKAQLQILKRQGNEKAFEQQNQLIEPLVYMHTRGILTDHVGIREASNEAEQKLSVLYEQFHRECGYECNPKSPKQLKELFYVHRNHRPYTSRSTGAISTDRDALKRLSRKGDQAAKILLEIRHLSKLKDTYYDLTLDHDYRLRCSFNPVGTTSGRLSSSKTIFGTGLNIQNLPDSFRRYLLVDPGYIGYQLDLSQAENRVVAYIAPDHRMMEAFENGIDLHRLTASLIFGKKMEDISDEPGSTPIGGGIYSERFWGKKANHGLNYDLGYKTFAFYYEIPESDSKYIVERYHAAYPGVRRYHMWVQQQLRTSRSLEDCLGKRRTFLGRWGDQLFKEAYSHIPQSSVAGKLNRDGMLHLWNGKDGDYSGVELLNQVHDAVWIQIPLSLPLEHHVKLICQLKRSLESPLNWKSTKFSIPVDVEAAMSNFGKRIEHDNGNIENPWGLKKLKFTNEAEALKQLTEYKRTYDERREASA